MKGSELESEDRSGVDSGYTDCIHLSIFSLMGIFSQSSEEIDPGLSILRK